ncbi:MAG TPA: CHAT domain-containing protein [Pyrinomonadaceae bacterium]|nr:CHAT domain-containing protein [Pyrinomonadaceae bacterium]
MSLLLRVFHSLTVSLIIINPVLAQSQSATTLKPARSTPTSAETAVLNVVERYYDLLAHKNLDELKKLWSANSAEAEARQKATVDLFAQSKTIAVRSFSVRQLNVTADKALVRVVADLEVIDSTTNRERPDYATQPRTLDCVRETDGWRVVSEVSSYDELALKLLAAGSDNDRDSLLSAETELITPQLSRAISRTSDKLRDGKRYPQALVAGQLALKVAEQLNDRLSQAVAWEMIGRAYAGPRDYRTAIEKFQRSLALFEALADRQSASSVMGRIASCYYYLENYQAAIQMNLKRLKLKEELNDREWIAGTLDDIATAHFRLGNYQDAIAAVQRAIPIYEELKDDGGVARMLFLLGNIQLEQGDYEQSIANYQKGGAIFARLGDAIGPPLATLSIGEAYSGLGDYNKALSAYEKALADFTANQNPTRMAQALYDIGTVYAVLTDYERARDYFRRSLALYEKASRLLGRAESLNAIGNSYRNQGDYVRALEYLGQGLKLLEESERKPGIAAALTEIGDLYLQQGDESQALEFYDRSQALFTTLGNKEKLAALTSRRGMLQEHRGNYGEALANYKQSLSAYKEIRNKHGMAESLSRLGNAFMLLKQPENAEASYAESQALFTEVGNKNGVASALLGLARLDQVRGNHAKAISVAEAAAELAENSSNRELLWELNSLIGKSQVALKQPDLAQRAFERAVSQIELLRTQTAGSESARRYFLEHRLGPYHSLITLLIEQNKPDEALVWAERSKARVLLDVMQSGRVDIRRAMTSDEQQEERRLRGELISLNTQLTRADQATQSEPARLKEVRTQLDKTRLSYESFQNSLYAAHPELRIQRGEAPVIKPEEIATLLQDPATVVLEYVVTDEATYTFAVTKAAGAKAVNVRTFTVPIKRAELVKRTEGFRQQLATRDLAFRDSAHQLYDLLVRPAQSQLSGKTNLIIVPDDMLLGLPFQALLTAAGRFVIQEKSVSYAPSLSALQHMTMRHRPQTNAALSDLLAFGNPLLNQETIARASLAMRYANLRPLPEAEQEVKALGRLYGPTHSKVYVGASAREDWAKAEAQRARVLHFATHATLNNGAPMYSHLVLAQGNDAEDGLLEAWELMELNLNADLVVLSACETARGQFDAGEGMIGLTWALFVAGAPTTVVSQWQVESASTRDLMVNFHRNLSSRLHPAFSSFTGSPSGVSSVSNTGGTKITKAEALRQAALKLLKDPETSHPFYWAGFVLMGDPR